jgi:hypothetical protein
MLLPQQQQLWGLGYKPTSTKLPPLLPSARTMCWLASGGCTSWVTTLWVTCFLLWPMLLCVCGLEDTRVTAAAAVVV